MVSEMSGHPLEPPETLEPYIGISEDSNLRHILAYGRAPYLKDYLVKSRFLTNGSLETIHVVN